MNRRQAGFSLIELMLALVAGLLVSSAVLAFALSSMKSNGEHVLSTRLTQGLRNTLDLVSRDLRRAGYDQDALKHLATGTASPFSHIQLSGECVIYSYDSGQTAGGEGVVELAKGEVRGVRRATRTVNGVSVGVIEYAESSTGVQPTCAGAAPNYSSFPVGCSTNNWCPLSDPTMVDVTAFTLTDNRSVVGTKVGERVQMRDLGVLLTGRLVGNTEYTRSVSTSVRIRSDCFDPSATGTNPTAFGVCTAAP